MKTYGEVHVYIHVFLTSALVGGEWSVSHLSRFTPKERAPQYPLDRRLGGPQNWPGQHGEEKNLTPTGTQTPTPQMSKPKAVAIPTELSWL
jgi:hypothetical protein